MSLQQHASYLIRNYGLPGQERPMPIHQRRVDSLDELDFDYLVMHVITTKTKDYGDKYVVRRHASGGGVTYVENACQVFDDLDQARLGLPGGLHRLERHPGDDPVIVEIWL